jgi:hypothetical protein
MKPTEVSQKYKYVYIIYNTWLNRTSIWPTFVVRMNRFSDYKGQINKTFLHWDFN